MPPAARKVALVPEAPAIPAGPPPSAALHRRRQRVVVRAPGSKASRFDLEEAPEERRQHFPTLRGLGFRDESDTLPAFGEAVDEPVTISCVRSRVEARVPPRIPKAARSLILPPRSRPTTLLDDVDDDVARKYREEAERLLASGIFDDCDDTE